VTHNPIPTAALDDRLAFIGTSGSGKTFAAKGRVELLLHKKHRVVVVDPLDVWFGLRLGSDGKPGGGFSVAILGGKHADLPITEHSGALIGEAVARSPDSCIVSLTGLRTSAARQRFMLAFLDALYERTDPDARDPYHVVFDEADLWAPQKPMGNEAMLAHLMEEIVRRGRVKGFIPWLITQRPAVLNKNVLSQADGLIALKLTSSQDRDAIGAWIEGQADRQQGKAILASLPTLKQGEGVVWIPGRGILSTETFPQNITFDSSRTPKRGEKKRNTVLKPLDLAGLKDKLATVEAETKANDPKALKAQIADLQHQLRVRPAETKTVEVKVADERALMRAKIEGYADAMKTAHGMMGGIREKIAPLEQQLAALKADVKTIEGWSTREHKKPLPSRRATPSPAASGDGTLSGPEQKIIDAIRWWNVLGVPAPSHPQVGFIAGYSHKSGTWATYLSRLRSAGIIEGRGGLVLTEAGVAAVNEPASPPTGEQLRLTVLSKLDRPLVRILRPMLEHYPQGLSHAQVSEAAGYSPASGTWATYLSRLRSLELIDGRGELKAQNWLFP